MVDYCLFSDYELIKKQWTFRLKVQSSNLSYWIKNLSSTSGFPKWWLRAPYQMQSLIAEKEEMGLSFRYHSTTFVLATFFAKYQVA